MTTLLDDFFDELNMEEVDSISNEEMNFKVEENVKYRIQRSVLEKAGFKDVEKIIENSREDHKQKTLETSIVNRTKKRRRTLVWAASIAALFCIVSIVGFDKIANAFSEVFAIIPGVGVVSEDKNIYVMDGEAITVTNDDIEITLENAFTNTESINLVMKVMYKKGFDVNESLLKGLTLSVDGSTYVNVGSGVSNYDSMVAGTEMFAPVSIDNKIEDINEGAVCTVAYRGLSIDFTMTEGSHGSLKDVAFTDSHNDITIAALVNSAKRPSLVNLYSYTDTKYRVNFLGPGLNETIKYKDQNIYLKMANGDIVESEREPYEADDMFTWENGLLTFDTDSIKGAKLIIPYICVDGSDESEIINLKTPNLNQSIAVNKKVKFEDSNMIITNIQKLYYEEMSGHKELALKLDVEYSNKKDNMILCRCFLTSMKGSSNGTEIFDENGVVESYIYYLNEEEADSSDIKIEFSSPDYYITDEYIINLDD